MGRPVRFIHAADLHLDAPFGGIDAQDSRVRDALAASTYRALDALAAACIERGADFLVISGDVYNQAERRVRSQLAFAKAAATLEHAGIPVFVVHGNHDPASGWSAGIAMPHNVHVFADDRVERVAYERDGEAVCALYGRSYRRAAETANLASGFKREIGDVVAIGVLHTNVGGRPGYDDYAPCTLDDLRAAGMDYWALGHIHKPEVLSQSPYAVYSGCPQGLDPTQSGPRGCYEVVIDDGTVETTFLPLAAIEWRYAEVDLSRASRLDDVRDAIAESVDAALADATTPVIVRLDLTGRCDVHTPLQTAGALAAIVDDARDEALGLERWAWIDRVRDRTRPSIDLEALRSAEDFTGDVIRLADDLLEDSAQGHAFVDEVAATLLDRVGDPGLVPDAPDILARARDLALDRLLDGDTR
ncbi:MAG: DNA repair exonuclease [Actinobacteria bacterium]|nr:MAG: DNA repair exonuclease [Actinomycetota bacterium]